MIAHSLKTIFVHITKTAGSSIEVALDAVEQRNAGATDPATGEHIPVVTGEEKHMNARECKALVDDQLWNEYFKFSVVRNPWDRFHSMWWNGRFIGKRHDMSLPEFAAHYLHKTLSGRLTSLRDGRIRIHQRFRPQVDWLKSDNGKIEMDYVCRFESIAEDFAVVSEKIGLPSADLPKVLVKNRSPDSRRHYSQDFDATTRDLIGDVYAEDIRTFNYQFENAG